MSNLQATPRVAVIGAGNWGRNLVNNFKRAGALAAVAEPFPPNRAWLADKHPEVPLVDDLQAALKLDVDAVAIATPVVTHFEYAMAALTAGKDVFVEKPMTFALAEAEELAATADKLGRTLMAGHLLLFQPAVQFIKRFLDEGGLGRVHSLHQERLNLGRARSAENALWSLGVHDIAVLLYLVGEQPEHLSVTGQRVLQPEIEDDVYLHLSFPSGTQAHLHNSWLWPEKRRRLTVVGSAGMLVYDEADQTVTLHRKGIDQSLANRDEGSELLFQGSGEPLLLEVEHFLSAVRTRSRPIADGQNGIAVVRILEQATRLLKGAST